MYVKIAEEVIRIARHVLQNHSSSYRIKHALLNVLYYMHCKKRLQLLMLRACVALHRTSILFVQPALPPIWQDAFNVRQSINSLFQLLI